MRIGFDTPASWRMCAALFLLAWAAIGCAAVRNPALENARDAYQKARQDPLIVRNAGAALDRAGQTLEAADQLWIKERDVDEVEHLAYIAEKRVEIARATAQRRLAAEELKAPAPVSKSVRRIRRRSHITIRTPVTERRLFICRPTAYRRNRSFADPSR